MTISEGYFQARGGWNQSGGLMGMAYRGEIVPLDMTEQPLHAAANAHVKFHGSDDKPDPGGTKPCCNVVLDDAMYVKHAIQPPMHHLPQINKPKDNPKAMPDIAPDAW